MNIVRLKIDDLSGLGNHGGNSVQLFEGFFYDAAAAREWAYKDYKIRHRKEPVGPASFKFKKEGNKWHSQDLTFLFYTIEPITVR